MKNTLLILVAVALVAIVGMLGVLIGKKSNPTPKANPTPKSNDSASLPISASLGVGMVGGVKVYYAVLLALVLGVGCCATAPKEGQARDANGTAKACTCKQCSGCDGSCCN